MIASRTGRDNQRFDQDGVQLKAGCVAVLDGQVVLISSSKNKSKWGLPKGGWELDETAEEAAIRETYEEAGVRGVIGDEVLTNESVSKSGELVKAKVVFLPSPDVTAHLFILWAPHAHRLGDAHLSWRPRPGWSAAPVVHARCH